MFGVKTRAFFNVALLHFVVVLLLYWCCFLSYCCSLSLVAVVVVQDGTGTFDIVDLLATHPTVVEEDGGEGEEEEEGEGGIDEVDAPQVSPPLDRKDETPESKY